MKSWDGWVCGGGASYGCLCDGNMWGESGRVGLYSVKSVGVSAGAGGEGEGVLGVGQVVCDLGTE